MRCKIFATFPEIFNANIANEISNANKHVHSVHGFYFILSFHPIERTLN